MQELICFSAFLYQYIEFLVFLKVSRRPPKSATVAQHYIPTKSSPVRVPPERFSVQYKSQIQAQIQDMLNKGNIEESSSPWLAPVVIVLKKSGKIRYCHRNFYSTENCPRIKIFRKFLSYPNKICPTSHRIKNSKRSGNFCPRIKIFRKSEKICPRIKFAIFILG